MLEEKSGRVAEVLLAAVRPARLLAGKVLGIGLVVFAQAALVAAVAAGLAAATGSDLRRGTVPLEFASTLAWLVLGYASAAVSVLCTVGVARLAAGVYRRAILRTGQRVRLREILSSAAR